MQFIGVPLFVACFVFPFGGVAVELDPTQVFAVRLFFHLMGEIVTDNIGNTGINTNNQESNYEHMSKLSNGRFETSKLLSPEKLSSVLNALVSAAEDVLHIEAEEILTEQVWFAILQHDEGQAITKHMNETLLPDGSDTMLTLFQKFIFGLIHYNTSTVEVSCVEYDFHYTTTLHISAEIVHNTFFNISKDKLWFSMEEFLVWCQGKTLLQLVTLHAVN